MREFHLHKRIGFCWFGFGNLKFQFNNESFAMWIDFGPIQITWLKV